MKEINGLLDSKAVVPIPLSKEPKGAKIIGSLTVRNVKKNGPNKKKAKSRVVINGKHQKDVKDAHSPTLRATSLRTIIAAGAALNANFAAGDFPQAYVNADNEEEMYIWPPASAPQYDPVTGERLVWKVPKALYGGKKSGRYWYNFLKDKLVNKYGFCLLYTSPSPRDS